MMLLTLGRTAGAGLYRGFGPLVVALGANHRLLIAPLSRVRMPIVKR